jgi:hypothetical protein
MKIFFTIFAIFAVIFLTSAEKPSTTDIVEENGICLDSIKALEVCLKESGEGKD